MPIIQHSTRPMPEPVDKKSARSLVAREDGAQSLTLREIVIHPGSEGRLHTHPTDEAIMMVEGSIQMIVGARNPYRQVWFHPTSSPGSATQAGQQYLGLCQDVGHLPHK